jgi:hypothetical protein
VSYGAATLLIFLKRQRVVSTTSMPTIRRQSKAGLRDVGRDE